MKSAGVRPYRLPLRVPYRWAHGVQTERAGLLVRLTLGRGVGLGEVAPPPEWVFDEHALAATLEGVLDQLDPQVPEFLDDLAARLGHHPLWPRLRCGVASAWLSARAADAGQPLARFLGGDPAPRVAVNDLITDAEPAACAERARAALARGQTTLKLKCTADRPLDLARVAAVRAVDAGLVLRLDPNESWSPAWVAAHLDALAPFGIEYVEQPLPLSATLEDYARLRRSSPIPIALDHAVDGPAAVAAILAEGAADVLILKPQRLGGPDVLWAVAEQAAGLRCTVTNSLETAVGLHVGLHCAARLPPAAAGLGTARYFARDVAPPPAMVDGHLTVPTEPGLGVQILDGL